MKTDYIYRGDSWSKEDPKEIIVEWIPEQSRVLDVGCGVGVLGEWLTKNKGCSVDGLEFHEQAVKVAKQRIKQVYHLNLEDHKKLKDIKGGYDVITLVDVLEHCLTPKEVLHILKFKLNKGGKILISLPNVAHHSVRFGLLRGRFEYADSGILDKTHVAFYTRENIELLLNKAEMKFKYLGATIPSKGFWKYAGKLDPSLSAVQYVYEAKA